MPTLRKLSAWLWRHANAITPPVDWVVPQERAWSRGQWITSTINATHLDRVCKAKEAGQ